MILVDNAGLYCCPSPHEVGRDVDDDVRVVSMSGVVPLYAENAVLSRHRGLMGGTRDALPAVASGPQQPDRTARKGGVVGAWGS